MDALSYVIILLTMTTWCDGTNTFINQQLMQDWQNEAVCYVI